MTPKFILRNQSMSFHPLFIIFIMHTDMHLGNGGTQVIVSGEG